MAGISPDPPGSAGEPPRNNLCTFNQKRLGCTPGYLSADTLLRAEPYPHYLLLLMLQGLTSPPAHGFSGETLRH